MSFHGSSVLATEPARRRRYQNQRRPAKAGRYKFKSNFKGWRSKDRRYKFNGETQIQNLARGSLLLLNRIGR
jgi:hypothetical protein